METANQEVKKVLNVSNEVLREALGAEINRLSNAMRQFPTQDEFLLKKHPEYANFCELSRKFYSKQRELQELNANDPVFQAKLKILNDKAILAFNSDKRFSITE